MSIVLQLAAHDEHLVVVCEVSFLECVTDRSDMGSLQIESSLTLGQDNTSKVYLLVLCRLLFSVYIMG